MTIFFLDDQLAHVLEEVAGEDEIRQAGVCRVHDFIALPLPFFVAFVDEDDILADTHHRVHVVGIDDGSGVVFLGDTTQQVVDDE